VLLIGMDTPHLLAADLDVPWSDDDAVLGPSCDGGYWSIGFRRHVPGAIRGVPMSTARTGGDQLVRLERLGLRVGLLPMMRDVDDPEDAAAVAAAAPATRFGRLHRRLVGSPCSPATLFDAALSGVPVEIRVADGKEHVAGFQGAGLLDAAQWGRLTEADEVVVSRCEGPVLDVGCGPGRFVEALACAGIPALGVDLSREAVRQTRGRGGFALLRDVHERVPGEGRWGTVLLADGNIGIGGDPLALLRRCRAVLRPGAVALVETSPDRGHDIRTTVTLHGPGGRRSHPVPWAVLGSAAVVDLAASAGFVAVEEWHVGGRAFVMLRHAG
jgi:SAM-dependent methyltransferase